MEQIATGIVTEYESRRHEIGTPFTTVYLGGGTPSAMPPDMLAEMIGWLPVDSATEFTIETNPEDVNADTVAAWCRAGVNRVSMGVQSLDNNILRWMRRRHDRDAALKAIRILRDGGITNISCDLIYGIPGLDGTTWSHSVEELLATGIEHLSAYCLTYSPGTALTIRRERRLDPVPSDDDIVKQYEILCRLTAEAGMEHYEISNFARPSYRSLHNSTYWSPSGRWLGLGPSAHSFDGITRRIDIPDIAKWLHCLPNPYEIDEETDLDRINDIIVTGLRTSDGLDTAALPGDIGAEVIADARRFISDGSMTLTDGRITIIPDKWLISDSFIRELIR